MLGHYINFLWDKTVKGDAMNSDGFDLEIALRRLQKHADEEGDMGYSYWSKVSKLLIEAARMRDEIARLTDELEACRSGKE